MGATYLIVALLRIIARSYPQCGNAVRGTYLCTEGWGAKGDAGGTVTMGATSWERHRHNCPRSAPERRRRFPGRLIQTQSEPSDHVDREHEDKAGSGLLE